MSHDPKRFYHCDCNEGGYTPPCADCKGLIAKYKEALANLVDSYESGGWTEEESISEAQAILGRT